MFLPQPWNRYVAHICITVVTAHYYILHTLYLLFKSRHLSEHFINSYSFFEILEIIMIHFLEWQTQNKMLSQNKIKASFTLLNENSTPSSWTSFNRQNVWMNCSDLNFFTSKHKRIILNARNRNQNYVLDQGFPNCGTCITSGMPATIQWETRLVRKVKG